MLNVAERPRRKRLSWESRCEVVAKVRLAGMPPGAVAATSGVHRATVYRLLRRFDKGGWAALVDRRPVPQRQPRRLGKECERQILKARRATGHGPQRLGAMLGVPGSTVGRVLHRAGVSSARAGRAATLRAS